ncbi:Demethylphylloquinone reductase NdbB [bacterium HR37]|nr:Demethylphylloquinone reductase NdbB [bacterium HR37]
MVLYYFRERIKGGVVVIRVVVLGSGFGGIEAVLNLERHFRKREDVELVLISNQNYTLFTPLLPQIVSSYIEPRHIVQTIRDIRRDRRFRFIRDRVIGIDLEKKVVRLLEGWISYNYLIIALGSTTNFFNIPGASEYTFSLKTLEDAVELRDHIIDILEHADHEENLDLKREMLTFAIVGGGYTGVELTAEIRDFIYRQAVKNYRGIDFGDVRIVLLEAASEILEGVDPYIAKKAKGKLLKEGIEVRTGARVTRCFRGGVEINNRDILRAGIVIWTAGVRANPVLDSLGVRKGEFGRILVNGYMQIPEFPEVYVIGDSAFVEGDKLRRSSQPVAPVAIEQARVAAKNIVNAIENRSFEEYSFSPSGMLVSLGMNDAVIRVGRIRLAGFIAWLLWNALHLLKLVGLKKQIQVAVDWMLAMVFPRDTAIIRFPRRCFICSGRAELYRDLENYKQERGL